MSEVQADENVTNNNNVEDPKPTKENGNALGGSLSASVSSLASSSASVRSGIPKPVGKPASHASTLLANQASSRIGRLCGNQHKPSLPSSPVRSSKLFQILLYFLMIQ